MKYKQGFTLIELLVVIAVIGLLASVVFVNLQSSRGKAKIAAGQQFDSQLKSVLGAYAVGSWRFEEGSGATTKDESGYGSNGTLVGGPVWRTATECGLGMGGCLEFDGVNDSVDIGSSAVLQNTGIITVAAWVKPTATPVYGNVTGKLASANGGWVLRISQGGNGRLTPHVFTNTWYTCSGSMIPLNVWSYITITYDGTMLKGYVNGKEDCAVTPTVGGNLASNALAIGIGGPTDYFPGSIDEVRIYNSSLKISEIQKLYAEGLPRHQLVNR